jgi:hypothetical protein
MNKKIGLLLAGLVLLPGCVSVPRYKAKPLNTLCNDFTYREITKNNVVLQSRLLTNRAIQYLFEERAEELLGSVKVIHCSIYNISNQDYVISAKNKNFKHLSANEVAQLLKTSTTARMALTTGIGGVVCILPNELFLAPALLSFFPLYLMPASIVVYSCVAAVAVVTPFVFFGKAIKSAVMNGRIKKDLQKKMLYKKDEVIKSGEKYEGLIFVKIADYKSVFTVTMYEKNKAKNTITFDVKL